MSNLGKNLKNYLQFFRQLNSPNIKGGYLLSGNHFRRLYLNLTIILGIFFIFNENISAQITSVGSVGVNQASCTNGTYDPNNFISLTNATGTGVNYQWVYSTATNVYTPTGTIGTIDPLWVPITGATGTTYNAPPVSETTYYARLVRSGSTSLPRAVWIASIASPASNAYVTVTVNQPSFYVTASSNTNICSGTNLNLAGNAYSYGPDLVSNGNFSSAATALASPTFSDFINTTGGDTANAAGSSDRYRINAVTPAITGWTQCPDLASRGRVLLINNSEIANERPWFQTGVSVTAGTTYTFSIEASSLTWINPAQLYLRVGGTTITPIVTLNGPCDWATISGTFTAPSTTTVSLEIVNQNGNRNGNNYMIDNIKFRANASGPVGTWSWTGPNSYSSTLIQSPTITGATSVNMGTYTATFTATVGGCISTATTTPTMKAAPSVSASNGGTVCEGGTISLTATATDPDGIGSGTWSWTGPGGFTSSVQNPTIPNATAGMAGTYTVVYTSSNGCSQTATANTSVTVTPLTTSLAGVDKTKCNSGSFDMTANTPTSGTGAWSFFGANNGATIVLPITNPTTAVTGLTVGE